METDGRTARWNGWTGILAGAVAVLAITGLGGLAVVYSGAVNVAASNAEAGATEWLLGTAMERSVRARAAAVGEPVEVDSALLVHGFEHYDAMCVECHGAPGIDAGETGRGLNPSPPELADEAHEWSDAELFWITKHGIKMTGMPAFGPTHSDEELWAIVAAVRRLEDMSPAEYAATVAAAGEHQHDEDDHTHEAGAESAGGDARTGANDGHAHPPGTPAHEH